MATFYIEAVENTDIALVMVGSPTIGTVKYGVNDSTCPNTYTVTTESTPISLTAGQKCYWTITKTTTAFSTSNYLNFTSTAKINVGGNLSDLIGGETKIPRSYCFYGLFMNCTKLVDASNLVVVNDFNSKGYCHYNMFYGCTSLTTPPELPATTITTYCYYGMFKGCTSLTTPPTLPATTVANACYQQMFSGCASLTNAPALPATTLVEWCYAEMFSRCSSLTTPPELPATTLKDYCYNSMFYNCSNIKLSETQTAPYSIPYRIPSEGTGTEGTSSLSTMFNLTGGTFAGTPTINTTYYLAPYATFYIEAVEDTDITLSKVGTPTVGDAYYGVENHNVPNAYNYGDTISLTAGQKCYWTITSTSENFTTTNYLKFTSTAKINVGGNISDLIGGETQIPRSYCFFRLFEGCSTLIDASSLVFVNDFNSKNNCYNGMFRECSSLIAIPDLLATTLTSSCYQYMFYNCSSLTVLPELPATTLANNCYNYMFFNCRNIKLSETQTAPYSIPYRIPSEGTGTEGTSSLNNMFGNTGGTFTGTPTINTVYYMDDYSKNVQLYDANIKLYPITKAENVKGLNNVVSGTLISQKGVADGVASLGNDGKVLISQLPIYDGTVI